MRPERLVLASASPARLQTLRNAGVDAVVLVSAVDEDALVASTFPPGTPRQAGTVAALLARAKAEDVVASHPELDAVVLGCDSVLELDGRVLGKPLTHEVATQRWRDMRGRRGTLHTGHWLVDSRRCLTAKDAPTGAVGARTAGTDDMGQVGERAVGEVASTLVEFADVSDAEIAAYVATGEPLQVAGAFTVDGLGGAFVSRIDGDHHNVVGVSLPLVRRLLAELGVQWTDLWRTHT